MSTKLALTPPATLPWNVRALAPGKSPPSPTPCTGALPTPARPLPGEQGCSIQDHRGQSRPAGREHAASLASVWRCWSMVSGSAHSISALRGDLGTVTQVERGRVWGPGAQVLSRAQSSAGTGPSTTRSLHFDCRPGLGTAPCTNSCTEPLVSK